MDETVKIIGFSGKMQSGKSTAVLSLYARLSAAKEAYDGRHTAECRRLKRRQPYTPPRTPVIEPFAGPLKLLCGRGFGFSSEQMETEAGKRSLHQPSGLTVRQVLQRIGTEVFRTMDPEFWVRMWRAEIEEAFYANPVLVLVPDVRFVNEAEAVVGMGGIVIRLMRQPMADDAHRSETELDGWGGFSHVVDNRAMTAAEQNEFLWDLLTGSGGYLDESGAR
jgi:hypothetical protein